MKLYDYRLEQEEPPEQEQSLMAAFTPILLVFALVGLAVYRGRGQE